MCGITTYVCVAHRVIVPFYQVYGGISHQKYNYTTSVFLGMECDVLGWVDGGNSWDGVVDGQLVYRGNPHLEMRSP